MPLPTRNTGLVTILAMLSLSIGIVNPTFAASAKSSPQRKINGFYIAANAGIYQGIFHQDFAKKVLPASIGFAGTVNQNGYTGGIAIGYNHLFNSKFLLGVALSGNLQSSDALYREVQFDVKDTTKLKHNIDLVVTPGFLLSNSITTYLKLGISCARVNDSVFTYNTGQTHAANKNTFGFVAGIGIAKYFTKHISLFSEFEYHDYGTVHFSDFRASPTGDVLTHKMHIYAGALKIGVAYRV